MKRNMRFFIILAVLCVCLINFFAYRAVMKVSNSMISLIKGFDFGNVAPITYLDRIGPQTKKPSLETDKTKQLQDLISSKSTEFIKAVFGKEDAKIKAMMDPAAKYIRSKGGSSFIRYVENGIHVEGYMATDKKLIKTTNKWCVQDGADTITCSMEVYIENDAAPQIWYLHFKRIQNDWKLYMLENDI